MGSGAAAYERAIGGQCVEQAGAVASIQQQPGLLYEIIDYTLPSTVQADGLRLVGKVGGPLGFATITELDVLSEPVALQRPTFAERFDVNGDGIAGRGDAAYLEAFVRWDEIENMTVDRR